MSSDPWRRPSMDDLKEILRSIGNPETPNVRGAERLELSVPAEIITSRGNTVDAITREISRTGIGLMHRGCLNPGEIRVKLASEVREFEYTVNLEWCRPCEKGMFISGGRFVTRQ